MAALCWDFMCGADCAYCVYKQTRYRQGFSTPCYLWFASRRIEKKCRDCRFYLEQRKTDPALPEDPAWHPSA
ncbi:MAG TPA: hypothetical protein VJ385_02590 [Fibrobacteria bacterium]|nr:hypothetical protein [Fibrobacteria bacterium]